MSRSPSSRSPSRPTETSPLLSQPEAGEPADLEASNGNGAIENGQQGGDVGDRGGLPEMAARMHLLIPALGIGIYLCAVDQLLTVATYAKIGSELHALNNTSWIATAYFITLTSFQPLYGKLSDIFGRKECLLFAYVVFGIGCLGCGMAQTLTQLCLARAVAGAGGGGMNSVVSILVSDIVPLRDRGLWQGYINIIFAAGTSTGAPLGGLVADSIGWRWSFLGQVPICIAAFLSVFFVLKVPHPDHSHWLKKVARIDFLGAFCLISAVIALLVGLDAGSNLGWSHTYTVVGLALAAPLFGVFILVEMKVASHPFAPGHIIFDRSLFACFLANFFGIAGQISAVFFLPLYFQAVEGYSATASGALLVPAMIAAVVASLAAGLFMRRTGRYYWLTVISFGVLLFASIPLAIAAWFETTVGLVAGLVVLVLGAGSGITTTLVALLSNAAVEDTAVVVACSYLFRSLGSSIGISVSAAVLQQVLRMQLAARLGGGDQAREIEERVRESLDYIKELPPKIAEQVRDSYQVATIGAMAPMFIFLVFAFVATFFIKEKLLKR